MRNYSDKTKGTCDMQVEYEVNASMDRTMRQLGFDTFDKVKDYAPAFGQYWEYCGFPMNRAPDLYKIDVAAIDHVRAIDTYMGIGFYMRTNRISQNRSHIILPHGWFRQNFGMPGALNKYSGRHPNVYSDRTFANPGCTPGTCLDVDHATWMSDLNPYRANIHSTAWGVDYASAGGMAYQEGFVAENIRFEGGMNGKNYDPAFQSWAITLNEPGENSRITGCMFANYNNGGPGVYGGTPVTISNCSFFYNIGGGIDLLCNNALSNILLIQPTGDNNRDGLIRLTPRSPQDAAGANLTIISSKLEARSVLSRLIVVRGNLGQLNLTITGGTNDFSNVVCDQLIEVEKGSGVAIDIRGLEWSSGMNSVYFNKETRKRVTGGMAFRGNSIGFSEDEGIFLRSRQNFAMNVGGGAGSPVIDSFTSNPSSVATTSTVTLSWQTTDAAEVRINGALQSQVDGSGQFTAGPNTTTFTLEAKGPGGTITRDLIVAVTTPAGGFWDRIGWTVEAPAADGANIKERMLDNSLSTFYMKNGSMATTDKVVIDMKRVNAVKGIEFEPGAGYNNSWPKKFFVRVAGANKVFTDVGVFQGAFNAVAIFNKQCQFIEMSVMEGNMGNWLNIADFRVRK